MTDAPFKRLGDYLILREVGRGGMGVVYEAEQESLGRHVALKVLPRSALLNEHAVARFRREARSAARLHHSNIVPVFGFGEADGLHYYVMQFIHGRGLDEVIAELRQIGQSAPPATGKPEPTDGPAGQRRSTVSAAEVACALVTGHFRRSPEEADDSELAVTVTTGSLAGSAEGDAEPSAQKRPGLTDLSGSVSTSRPYFQEVARVGMQVASALAYAHDQGILHRDIKPSNLLLDLQGTVWVTDFGLAKSAADANLTDTGDIVGTLRFMAPERFNGHADARSDIYALGLTLYEFLTLRPAFESTDRNKLIQLVTEGEPARPRSVRPEIPRDLETICLKCLEKEPRKRYGAAEDLAGDLQNWLEGRPISARPVPAWERLSKWVRRKPALAALAAVSILALVSLLAGGTWFTIHLSRALDIAMRERFASDMNLAHLSCRDQSIPRVQELLDRYRGSGAQEYRSFEWSYLASLCDPHRRVLRSTKAGRLISVSYSPDGHHLAAGEVDGTVRIWDLELGVPIRTLTGHLGRTAVVYSPEGSLLATSGDDGSVRLWDVASGSERFRSRVRDWGASFSSDGRRFAISTESGAEIRSTTGGQALRAIPFAKGARGALALSPDGRSLATFSQLEDKVKLWDVATGQTLRTFRAVGAPCFSQDGRFLAISEGRFISVWEPATGNLVRRLEVPRSQRSAGGAFLQRHTAGGFDFSAFGNGSYYMEFSRDGRRLANRTGNLISVWDTETWTLTFIGAAEAIDASIHPDGRHLASASGDEIIIWDEVTRREQPVLKGHAGNVSAIAFSPDGSRIASASYDQTVKLWDAGTGRLERTLQGHRYTVYCVAFDPAGQRLASGSEDQDIRLWDAATGEPSALLQGHTGPVYGVAFSADGRLIASAGGDATVRLWNAQAGKEVRMLRGHDGPVFGVAFSPDGRLIASAGLDKTVRLWDAATGASRGILTGHVEFIHAVAFSPDGRRIASASEDQTVRVWDVSSGRDLATLAGHTGPVYGVTFTPDGRRVISAGGDKLVKVWDPVIAQETLTLRNHTDRVSCVAIDPKGRRLASGSWDKTIRIWEATTTP